MDEPLYRVVLTGELLSGFESRAGRWPRWPASSKPRPRTCCMYSRVASTRSRMCSVRTRPRCCSDAWSSMGASSRVDRVSCRTGAAVQRSRLQLPSHDDPLEAGLMHCPACGHAQLVAKSCDECGVVFANINREQGRGPFGSIPAASAPGVRGPQPRSAPRRAARHSCRCKCRLA